MGVEVALDTPLAAALSIVIQPKLIDVGWSTGGGDDDSALSEYIILMLVNGKTQDQIAAELSGELLNLGPDDPGANDFASWLFEKVEVLDRQINQGQTEEVPSAAAGPGLQTTGSDKIYTQENEDPHQSTLEQPIIPTGPRSMRVGGDKRMFNQINRAMDRSHDNVLHRVRGSERVNSHSRDPPRGPRNGGPRQIRGMARGMGPGGMQPDMMGPAGPMMNNMTPQQHMQLLSMYEEQAKMMAQFLTPQQQQQMPFGGMPAMAVEGPGNFGGNQQKRPLSDRVQGRKFDHRRKQSNGNGPLHRAGATFQDGGAEGSMDVDSPQSEAPQNMEDTTCKFNLSCTKSDCPYAHQSPAAPPGTTIDVQDSCPFGAACKNKKCVARHPSPAQKTSHQAEQECKFFPNCSNPSCPFRHPSMPVCRNGAECSRSDCKFFHVKTVCKYNPCLNPVCPFKHDEGQKRGKFADKVWTADMAQEKQHVSERKFVDESDDEELIIPTGQEETSTNTAEVAG